MLLTIELVILAKKNDFTKVFSHNYAKVKIDSYDSLSLPIP